MAFARQEVVGGVGMIAADVAVDSEIGGDDRDPAHQDDEGGEDDAFDDLIGGAVERQGRCHQTGNKQRQCELREATGVLQDGMR